MKDNNQLPEPELGYIQTDKSNQPAFSARQMREAMKHALQARAQAQGEPSWWMRETDEGAEWTDTAPLVLSGWTPLYTTPQPAQATQAEVTDADIDAVTVEQWGEQIGVMLQAHRAYARAILALRAAATFCGYCGGNDEDPVDHCMDCTRPAAVPMTDEALWTAVIEHLGPEALSGGRMSILDAFHLGITVAEAHHGITAQAKKETP